MPEDTAIETQATELLRTLIRNGCVNTGEAASGHEDRSVDALEDFFAGSGLSCERYTSAARADESHHADRGQRSARPRRSCSWATPTWCP